MSITSNLVYNYTPSITSCSSVYVVDEEIELWLPSPSIGVILRPRGRGATGNGSQVLTASMLTVLRLISSSVGLKQRACRYACVYVRAQR